MDKPPRRDVKLVIKKVLREGRKIWYGVVSDYKTGEQMISSDMSSVDRCIEALNLHIMELIDEEALKEKCQ